MVIHGLEISNEEKEKTFDEMIKIALEVAKMCG
jgi:purine-nucleoside phosphorylase